MVNSSGGVFEKNQDFSKLTKEHWLAKAFALVAENRLLKGKLEEKAREEFRLTRIIYDLNAQLRDNRCSERLMNSFFVKKESKIEDFPQTEKKFNQLLE